MCDVYRDRGDQMSGEKELDLNEITDAKAYLMQNMYTLDYRCLNCQWKGQVHIKRGQLVTSFPCPGCGCTPKQVCEE